jgi:hypothetical protein
MVLIDNRILSQRVHETAKTLKTYGMNLGKNIDEKQNKFVRTCRG